MAAEKLKVSEEAFSQKLEALQHLLPGLLTKVAVMGPDRLAQLAANPSQLAQKLVRLKQIFPQADTSRMVAHQMSLVLKDDLEKIAAAADELRSILPTVNVDKYAAWLADVSQAADSAACHWVCGVSSSGCQVMGSGLLLQVGGRQSCHVECCCVQEDHATC